MEVVFIIRHTTMVLLSLLILCTASIIVTASPQFNQYPHEKNVFPAAIRLDDELNGARLDVTTYAPRPTTSMPQSQLRSLCLTPRGKFPHPLDCRKYVDCWDGRVLEKRCPNDLVYSDLPGEFCDYLEYVDCGTRPVLLDANEQVVSNANVPIAQPPQNIFGPSK